MKTVTYVGVVLAAMLLFGRTLSAQKAENDAKKIALVRQVLGQAKVDFASALATAEKKIPNGKPLVGRTELIKESARFGFYFLEGEKVQEVEVDARTGEIVKLEETKEPGKVKKFADAMKALQGAKVSFKEAMAIAARRVKGGRVFEVELELDGDRAVVEVELLVGERITRVRIDAKDATSVTVK